jgi:RES domain-containing protein
MVSQPDSCTRAYRIVSPDYPPFDGSGTHRWGSRWISPGRWVVHVAETYSLAVLENLVHWQTRELPPHLVCIAIDIPDVIAQEQLASQDLPPSALDDYSESRAIGDDWYDQIDSAVLWVPSVVSPYEHNLLINQRHRDFSKIIVRDAEPAHIDPRLWPAANG